MPLLGDHLDCNGYKLKDGSLENFDLGLVKDEIPAGLVNGSNATFTTQFNFVAGTEEVYVNGIKQKIIDDYQSSGNNTILLNFSPNTGETISVNYQKS